MEFCESFRDKYFLQLHISNIRRIAVTEFINSFRAVVIGAERLHVNH